MESFEDFVVLVRAELGLTVSEEQARGALDAVPDWDSVQMLWLVAALEKETGRTLPFASVLEAGSLEDIYRLAVAA